MQEVYCFKSLYNRSEHDPKMTFMKGSFTLRKFQGILVFLCGLVGSTLPAEVSAILKNSPAKHNLAQSGPELLVFEQDIDNLTEAVNEVYQADLSQMEIILLKGGFSGDRVYKVVRGGDASIIKVFANPRPMNEKKQECLCAQNAFDLALGPKPLYISKNFDVLMTAFVSGQHPDAVTFNDFSMIEVFASNLKTLHDGPVFILPWDNFYEVRRLTLRSINRNEKLALSELGKIEKAIRKSNFPSKPCHNDIWQGNMLVREKQIFFIDWGQGRMGDPYFDLAEASVTFAFNPDQDEALLSNYCGRITDLERSRFFLMKQVVMLKWAFGIAVHPPDQQLLPFLIRAVQAQYNTVRAKDQKKVANWEDVANRFLHVFLINSRSFEFKKSLQIVQKSNETK